MNLDGCLPVWLRGASISRIRHGLSGAGVYRVDSNGQRFVLKVSEANAPVELWRRQLALQQLAADAGVAPRVLHHEEAHRAVVSEFVGDARMRALSVATLGHLLKRVHSIPLPEHATWTDPREKFVPAWNALTDFTVPSFARAAVERVFAATPPPRERPLVLSHNDPNPSNLVSDGQRVLLIDWDSAGPGDPSFDLAAVALFLRLDDAAASALIAAHDDARPAPLSPYFKYARRLLAAGCGAIAFQLARRAGHVGGEVREEDAPTLRSLAGTLHLSTPDGLWAFALALVRAIDA